MKYSKLALTTFLVLFLAVSATALGLEVSPSNNLDTGKTAVIEVTADQSRSSIWVERWSSERNEWVADKMETDCNNGCSLTYSYRKNNAGVIEVRGNGGNVGATSKTNLEWSESTNKPPEESANIESIDIDPSGERNVNLGESVRVDVTATGSNVESIWVEKWSDSRNEWIAKRQNSAGCSGSKCDVSYNFERNSESSISVRGRAVARNSENSNTEASSENTIKWVKKTPQPAEGPTADITVSDSSIEAGQSVSFDAFDSQEGDSPIKEYKWNFEDGENSFDRAVSRTYDSPGEKQATLTVTDTNGNSDTDRTTVSVEEKNESSNGDGGEDGGQEEPEEVNAVISVSNNNPFIGESVRFDGSRSKGNIKEYKWEFEDATSRFGKSVFKSFSSEGKEQVYLRVTDTNGNSDTASVSLNVPEQKQCRVNVGGVSFSDTDTTDDETEGSLKITNTGEPQDVNVQLFANNEKISDTDATLGTGAERKFRENFADERGTEVRAEVRTSGDPCGSGFFERSSTFNEVTGDREPVARLDIDPGNADVGEEIDFDAGDSEDLDGRIKEYEFDLDGDGDYEISEDDSEVKETFFEEIERTAKVRVTDNDGNTDTAENAYSVRAESRVSFSDINTPSNVCAGESFDVTFTAENVGESERLTVVEGEGLGDVNSYSTLLEEGESEEVTVTFTPASPGTKEFTISSVGGNSDTIDNSIEVLDCDTVGEEVDGISMKVVPDRVRAGKSVKISGYVDNARGRENVEIEINDRDLKQVSTEPDGYYSTYIYPERAGDFELTARTDQYRATRKLTVLPTVTVGNMKTPETVFQGDKIEVCADVNSQKIPSVLLLVDGEIVESTNDRGTVCFDTVAKKEGEVNYEIVGLARGERSSAEREVEVHEAKPEASSFPGQIASVDSGRGIVKATIYNNNDVRTKYFVGINGLPNTWTSTTEKEVILQPGEEKEVFFYLTPREEGEFNPLVTITSDSKIVYTERVPVEVGGTKTQRKLSLYERLKNVFL